MEYLIQNTFGKMRYLKRLAAEPLKEVQAVLRSNDIAKENLLFQTVEKRYALRVLLLARLMVLSEINLMMDSTLLPIDKVDEAITTPAKRRKIIIRKRETSDPKAIQNARSLGKDLFAEMGLDGEDGLTTFFRTDRQPGEYYALVRA
jgi:ATP:corrinoid adenosyltransferase